MKRKFTAYPVLASERMWPSVTDVTEVKEVIKNNLDRGTTLDDIDDYLNVLYSQDAIDDEEFSELINWAAQEIQKF